MAPQKHRARPIILWILVVLCALLFAIGYTLRGYARFSDQLSTLGGISLGDSRGDARYKLGVPPAVYGSDEPGEAGIRVYYTDVEKDPQKDPGNALPAGTDINSFRTWSYELASNVGPHLDLTFDPRSEHISKITCVDRSNPPTSYCGRFLGMAVDDPEARIIAQLGSPTRQLIDDTTGVKTMEYADVGIVFLLARQRVFGISVFGTGLRKQPPLARFITWYTADLKAALRS